MAFDAFRTQDERPKHLRRVIIGVAAVLHGALIAAGVVYSYWHVDELTPPTLRVTFISAAPPPPPPPPPPAGGGAPKKVAMTKPKPTTPVVVPKPTDIVQPRERPAPVKKEFRKHDDEEEDDDEDAPRGGKGGVKGGVIGGEVGGEVGGVKGGVIGGAQGGTGSSKVAPKFLTANEAEGLKVSGDLPVLPAHLNRAGHEYLVMAKICISTGGAVESVTVMKGADSELDASVVAKVKTWRFRPRTFNAIAVPYCYIGRFEFKSLR
jgi:hypothetical protein